MATCCQNCFVHWPAAESLLRYQCKFRSGWGIYLKANGTTNQDDVRNPDVPVKTLCSQQYKMVEPQPMLKRGVLTLNPLLKRVPDSDGARRGLFPWMANRRWFGYHLNPSEPQSSVDMKISPCTPVGDYWNHNMYVNVYLYIHIHVDVFWCRVLSGILKAI